MYCTGLNRTGLNCTGLNRTGLNCTGLNRTGLDLARIVWLEFVTMVFQYIFNVLNNKVQIQMQFKMAATIVNGGGVFSKIFKCHFCQTLTVSMYGTLTTTRRQNFWIVNLGIMHWSYFMKIYGLIKFLFDIRAGINLIDTQI